MDNWQEARLIPVAGISGASEAEQRATSALLSVLGIVRPYRHLPPLSKTPALHDTICRLLQEFWRVTALKLTGSTVEALWMAKSGFQKRREAKNLAKIQEIETAQGWERSYVAVNGKQKLQWSDTTTIVFCVFAVAFVVALLAGYVIFPGGIVLAVAFNSLKPTRTISLTTQSAVVWEHSFWSNGIKGFHYASPRGSLRVADGWATVGAGIPIKLSRDEVNIVIAEQRRLQTPTPPPPAFAPQSFQ